MIHKTISRIIFIRVLLIITVTSVIALILGTWIIRNYYLRTSLEELMPDAIRISEALAEDPYHSVVTDRTDVIIKAYNPNFDESFHLTNPNITPSSLPDAESGIDMNAFRHPVITDSTIKEALDPYMSSVLSGNMVKDIHPLPPLEGTSIVVGLPIVHE